MTLQSHPNVEEVGPSPSCSTSTSSTDVSPYPYSVGEKTIVLNNEEQTLVGVVTENEFLGTNPNIWVESSTHVDIGNRTFFHGDVTIYQNFPNNVPEVPSGPIEHAVNCTKTGRANQKKPDQGLFSTIFRTRSFIIPIALVLLIILSVIAVTLFKQNFTSTFPKFLPINPNTTEFIGGHPIYSKDNWGGAPALTPSTSTPTPISLVIICHSATESCTNFTECAKRMQTIQQQHVKDGHRDISYNFLIGEEGGVYVGRGWDSENSQRAGSLSIGFIGDFNKESVKEAPEEAAKALLDEGLNIGKLANDYKLVGENQTHPQRYYSPGLNLARVITNWDHYFSGTMF